MDTITSTREIDALFRRARRARRRTVVVLVGPTPSGCSESGRVVFVAGKRLGSAVLRNRCKRVLRAAVRDSQAEWPGRDVALIATDETATSGPGDVARDLTSAMKEAGVER